MKPICIATTSGGIVIIYIEREVVQWNMRKYSLTGLPDHVWSLINDFEINLIIPRKLVRLGK